MYFEKNNCVWVIDPGDSGPLLDWIKSKNLRGVGLWAMGYSQGSIDIWQGISKSFGVDSLVKTEPIKSSLSGPYGLALSIHNNKKIIGLGFLIFVGFVDF